MGEKPEILVTIFLNELHEPLGFSIFRFLSDLHDITNGEKK
jgi:hypothetical protein